MRIFSRLRTSLGALAVVLATVAISHPGAHTVLVPAKLKALDIPVSQFDQRFGDMVAEVPCTVPYTFVNGTVANADQVNANFTAVITCLSTIYASDIVPTNNTQATFGGGAGITYTFPGQINVQAGPLGGVFTTLGGNNGLWLV